MNTMLWLAPLQKISSRSEMRDIRVEVRRGLPTDGPVPEHLADSASISKAYSLVNPMAQSFQSRPSWGATRNETG